MTEIENITKEVREKTNKVREQLFYWQHGGKERSWFSAQLFYLFQKADNENVLKCMKGFPIEWAVYLQWYRSKDPDQLFKDWGFEL